MAPAPQEEIKPFLSVLSRLGETFAKRLAQIDRKVMSGKTLSVLREEFPIKKMSAEELQKVAELYLERATQIFHPRYMGHQISNPHPSALVGDFLQSLTNNSIAVYDMGAPGIAIERNLIEWFLKKVGWSMPQSDGLLTHGGSLANLTALLAARAHAFPQAWEEGVPSHAVIFGPETAHYCVTRSLSIMGLGQKNLRKVKCFEDGAMDPLALAKGVSESLSKGEKIIAIVATAASTASGSFDPLQSIAKIAKAHGVWFHVDGAHGASVLVSHKWKSLVAGIEEADSLVWDAHKMMRAPSLCTAVLFRDKKSMRLIFNQDAPYLSQDQGERAPHMFPYTVECTRPSLGLKFYPVLAALGDEGLAHYIDHSIQQAQEIFQYLREQPEFEAPLKPACNIVLFRVRGLDDEAQHKIYEGIIQEGLFHITFAKLHGRSYLRLTLMNPETKLKDFQNLAQEVLRKKALVACTV